MSEARLYVIVRLKMLSYSDSKGLNLAGASAVLAIHNCSLFLVEGISGTFLDFSGHASNIIAELSSRKDRLVVIKQLLNAHRSLNGLASIADEIGESGFHTSTM